MRVDVDGQVVNDLHARHGDTKACGIKSPEFPDTLATG